MLLQFLKRSSLSFKLNALLILTAVLIVVALQLIINTGFSSFLNQVSQEQITAEMNTLQEHFGDIENATLNAAKLLSSVPGLSEAIETGDSTSLRTSILLQAESLGIDEVHIVNSDGVAIVSTRTTEAAEAEKRLIGLGLIGADTTGLITNDEALHLAAAVSVKNAEGNIIGMVLTGRMIDEAFVDDLNFARTDFHTAIIYEGELAAQSSGAGEEFSETDEDEAFIIQAQRGQVSISDVLAEDANDTPDAVGYAPLRIGSQIQAVLAVRIELGTMLALQARLATQNLIVVGALALIMFSSVFILIRQNLTLPLLHLKTTSELLAGGDLNQRTSVTSQDEIGQLAMSFNSMADQIQVQLAILEDQLMETEEARADAVRSDQVKSAFLASMSHELRTPLNAVINFTRFVIDGDTGPVNDEQTELLTQVVASARHLLNLINDVLDMSKIEAGALNLFVEDNISLNTLLKSAAATGQSLLVGKPVRLRTEVEDNLPLITGDRQRMLQILLNIISNACKFTEEGEVIIRAHQQDEEVIISVSDTGPGISQEDQLMVFEAFKQTNTGLRQGGGTGLGMPIARSLAEAHGGRLWLESEFGKGANFYVAFPVKSEALVAIMA